MRLEASIQLETFQSTQNGFPDLLLPDPGDRRGHIPLLGAEVNIDSRVWNALASLILGLNLFEGLEAARVRCRLLDRN